MLQVEALTKTYEPAAGMLRLLVRTAQSEPVHALRGIDFEVAAGEVVGLVGPNGAGKSTLLRVCTTLLTPTSGRVLVDGMDVVAEPEKVRSKLGIVLGDERALYWRLTGRQNLMFFGAMSGLPRSECRERADELLERFGLAENDRRVFGYSSGMRSRLSLARALLHRPKMLFLDEPSRSLDPMASDDLQQELQTYADAGSAVILSSHRLDEVEAICDRVLVIVDGAQRAWARTVDLAHGSEPAAVELRRLLAEPKLDQGEGR